MDFVTVELLLHHFDKEGDFEPFLFYLKREAKEALIDHDVISENVDYFMAEILNHHLPPIDSYPMQIKHCLLMIEAIADWEAHKDSETCDYNKMSHNVGRILCHAMVASGYFDSSIPSVSIMNQCVEYHMRGKKALREIINDNVKKVDEANQLKENVEKSQKGRKAGGKAKAYSPKTRRAVRVEARALKAEDPSLGIDQIATKITDELKESRARNRGILENHLREKYHMGDKLDPSWSTIYRKWLNKYHDEALDPTS